MERKIEKKLADWKNSSSRLPKMYISTSKNTNRIQKS